MNLTRIRQYMKRNPFTVILGIILILYFSRSTLLHSPKKRVDPPLPKVMVTDMTAKPVDTCIHLNGHTTEARRVTLKAKTGGRIMSIVATKGQLVQEGQDIVLIDPEDRPSRLLEAEARMNQRSLEFKADTKLEAKSVKSQNALAASSTDYASAKSALAAIEQEIADTHIKAPFKSIFEDRFVEIGDVVSPGDQIGTVIELDPLKIICDISEKDISRIKIGEKAEVTLTSLNTKKLNGVVTYIAKAAEPKTRTYRVEMKTDNPDMVVPAGLTARIRFPTTKTNGYRISPATISLKDDGTIGVKTVEGGKVVFHPVKIIESKPNGLLVTGLPDHMTLITVGGDFVVDGQKVRTAKTPKETPEKHP